MKNKIKKIDFFTVSKEWVYENHDQLTQIINERVLDELDEALLDPEYEQSVYNACAIRNCAKIVGKIFGFEIGFYESGDKLSMVEYDLCFNYFNFETEFSWVLIGESPKEVVNQDQRMLKLARTKRGEFIAGFQLRERVESWFDYAYDSQDLQDEFLNADDAEFIRMYFVEMGETMEYLLDKVYCRALMQSIHSS